MKNKNTIELTAVIFGFVIGLAGWIYLVQYDFKLALAITCVMWGNNLSNKYN